MFKNILVFGNYVKKYQIKVLNFASQDILAFLLSKYYCKPNHFQIILRLGGMKLGKGIVSNGILQRNITWLFLFLFLMKLKSQHEYKRHTCRKPQITNTTF